jgi:hypothetical protein
MKKKSRLRPAAGKEPESQRLAETVTRYRDRREAVGEELFHDYDLALVAKIAAQVSSKNTNPDDAVEHALRILDASRRKLSARAQKRETIATAAVPVRALHCNFHDGIRAITEQNRNERAEEYFRKFLVSEIGTDAAANELERLKRDGFTLDQVRDYECRYKKFRPPRRKKN